MDYLAANTNVLCVVNTTGTPYFGKQVLKDVVVWYGLAEGIADGVLARKLTASNNIVLQASTRCLRQVPGNTASARIYIGEQNRSTLDNQLQETYGETISSLNKSQRRKNDGVLRLRKLHPPPLTLTLTIRTVVRETHADAADLLLERPETDGDRSMSKTIYSLGEQIGTQSVLKPVDEADVDASADAADIYAAAVGLASLYRLDVLALKKQLEGLYPEDEIPGDHLEGLRRQIEDQTCRYRTEKEEMEVELAIVKPEG